MQKSWLGGAKMEIWNFKINQETTMMEEVFLLLNNEQPYHDTKHSYTTISIWSISNCSSPIPGHGLILNLS